MMRRRVFKLGGIGAVPVAAGSTPPGLTATLHFDGACRGNPGSAGIGFLLKDSNGQVIEEFCRFLGYNLTNNVAEYKALIAGLQHALDRGITDIVAYGDSELVCKHVSGEYTVRNVRLTRYYNTVLELHQKFQTCRVVHVPREENNDVDLLANRGIDKNPVDDSIDKILQHCGTRMGATNYILEKRCEGYSQLRFILDTIKTHLPDSYAAVQNRCVEIKDEIQMSDYNICMPCLLAEY